MEYFYTGECCFASDNVDITLALLECSRRFLVEGLQRKCELALARALSLENVFAIYSKLSHLYLTSPSPSSSLSSVSNVMSGALSSFCANFILENYETIGYADDDFFILNQILDQL